jgi:hypothetical protein
LQDNRYVKVKKVDTRTALNVGVAWLLDAEKGIRHIRKYGEGGTSPSQTVIDRILLAEGNPEGATKLLAWLDRSEGHPLM